MVLFENVNVNQRVEVKRHGHLCTGIVKYKGRLNGLLGDWVGVALDYKVGKHDGMLKGWRYFQCMDGHGIFTKANNIRFIQTKRCLYHKYRLVEDDSLAEEELFGLPERPSSSYSSRSRQQFVDEAYLDRSLSLNSSSFYDYDRPNHHPLRHSVGNHIPAATMLRPETARARYSYTSSPIYYDDYYEDSEDDFITRPSIPRTHMPKSALKKQVERGWDDAHYVRDMSVNTGRDRMKYSTWNDTY